MPISFNSTLTTPFQQSTKVSSHGYVLITSNPNPTYPSAQPRQKHAHNSNKSCTEQAWIEASTKGAVLLFVASEAEYYAKVAGASDFVGGISGGMAGGLAQAYATMGFCTCMKTVEITKHKAAATGAKVPGTMETFMAIYRAEGIAGINKGVNAVAVRQVTNWGSRFGLSRVAETGIRKMTGKEHGEKLGVWEKILASAIGGGLSAWNQPIEVVRVEMQSKKEDPNRPKKMTVGNTFKYIYQTNGLKGLYRGVTPRIGLGIWQTICMVALGDVYVLSPFQPVTLEP
jgi:Mitochondrial carrier protein